MKPKQRTYIEAVFVKPSPPAEANNVRPASMDSEALGQYIANQTAGVLRHLEDLRPFYEELWKRFDKLLKGQKILDCSTRTEYCEKILHRTIRSVQHALYGRRSLNARISTIVENLQSEQLIEKDQEREELEQEEESRKQLEQDKQKYQKLKLKSEKSLTAEELKFIDDHEWSRYIDLTEFISYSLPEHRKHRKNLSPDDLKFLQDYETKSAERRAKRAEEVLQKDIKKIRERAEQEEREGTAFNPEDFWRDLLGGKTITVSSNVHTLMEEIIKDGFRNLATRHHPDKGGTQQQMQDLNQAHSLLKQFIRSVKTEQQSGRDDLAEAAEERRAAANKKAAA